MFYDLEGNPTTRTRWILLFDDIQGRRIGLERIGDVSVSTVWTGLDHSYESGGPPLLWETLVRRGGEMEEMYRYASREDALTGHVRLVAEFRLLARLLQTSERPP